jgi:carboxyl-terminal processing protease
VLVLGIAVATGGWFLQQGVEQDQNVYFQARLFEEVVSRIASDYVEEVDKSSLYKSAIDGLMQELGDPNSSFMEASEYENLRIRTQGEYGGVGLEIIELNGFVTVVAPIPGTPSARAGLRAGDQFVEIAGQPAQGWESDKAVDLLRGEPGTEVAVKVRRIGVDQPIAFTLVREKIVLRSVPFGLELRDGIAYVPLQIVMESSSSELRATLDSLGGEDLEGIVLDLRGNPGGLLEQGIAVSDLFLEDGAAIVETRGRGSRQTESFDATGGDRYEGVPVTVLVDENSASASEIIAGALQDHDRAVVVGMPSFGKGSVQTLFRLTGGNVLRLTTARWYTPVGRSIDKPHEEREAESDTLPVSVRLDGMPTSPPVLSGRPVVRSRGGRALYGGGGITPDVVIMADTLTEEEEQAVRTIDRVAGAFEDALLDFAFRYVQERPNLTRDFAITEADLDRLYASLPEEVRAQVARETLRTASRYLRFRLERHIAGQKWGEPGQFERRVPYDLQLQAALDLLERAESAAALIQLVGQAGPEAPAAEAAGRAAGR